jgi:hypothetical protein
MFLRWPASPHFLALRGLAWRDDLLYASHGYSLLRARVNPKPNPNLAGIERQRVARYSPAWWRNLSATSRLTFRLCRDGFHALAVGTYPQGEPAASLFVRYRTVYFLISLNTWRISEIWIGSRRATLTLLVCKPQSFAWRAN